MGGVECELGGVEGDLGRVEIDLCSAETDLKSTENKWVPAGSPLGSARFNLPANLPYPGE